MMKSLDERLKEYQPLWENWYIDSLIYNGANSRVYKIKRSRDGAEEFAALKVVTITLENDMFVSGSDGLKYLEDRCQNAKTEIRNMIKLQRSPYIVSYFDDVTKEILDETGAKTGYDILIRMEYLECFGARVRKKEQTVTVQDVINMAYDIGNALKDVHKQNMIHRDIKPDNIFIDEQGYYKLGDLGVTKSINASGYASTRTGTEPYAAPEVWKCDSSTQTAYTYRADIYSFGIVLYQLMNNNLLPFMTQFTHNELEKSVSMRMRGERVPKPANGSERFKEIICRMCDSDPKRRFDSMSAFLSALVDVGEREESTSGSGELGLGESFPEDSIPTIDANEGFDYVDTDGINAQADIGTYMPVVGVPKDQEHYPTEMSDEQKAKLAEVEGSYHIQLLRPESFVKKTFRVVAVRPVQPDAMKHILRKNMSTEMRNIINHVPESIYNKYNSVQNTAASVHQEQAFSTVSGPSVQAAQMPEAEEQNIMPEAGESVQTAYTQMPEAEEQNNVPEAAGESVQTAYTQMPEAEEQNNVPEAAGESVQTAYTQMPETEEQNNVPEVTAESIQMAYTKMPSAPAPSPVQIPEQPQKKSMINLGSMGSTVQPQTQSPAAPAPTPVQPAAQPQRKSLINLGYMGSTVQPQTQSPAAPAPTPVQPAAQPQRKSLINFGSMGSTVQPQTQRPAAPAPTPVQPAAQPQRKSLINLGSMGSAAQPQAQRPAAPAPTPVQPAAQPQRKSLINLGSMGSTVQPQAQRPAAPAPTPVQPAAQPQRKSLINLGSMGSSVQTSAQTVDEKNIIDMPASAVHTVYPNKPPVPEVPVQTAQQTSSGIQEADMFATHMPEPVRPDQDEAISMTFRTYPAQHEAVKKINESAVRSDQKIVSSDGTFRKEDFHNISVRNGVLDIPEGYSKVNAFTLYQIERNLIEQINIPSTVTAIDEGAFRDLPNLRTVNISGDIMIIRAHMFSDCRSLETVVLPLGVRKIEDYAFEGCSSLRNLDARGYITSIGKNSFDGCSNVTVICNENSFMHKYCVKYNLNVKFADQGADK